MPIPGLEERDRKEAEEASREEMERLAARLLTLIESLPSKELLGYIWSTMKIASMLAADDERAKRRT
jgi:hypothetical protein